MYRVCVAFLALALSSGTAWSQAAQPVTPVVGGLVVSGTNPLPVTGTISVPSPLDTNSTVFLGGNPVSGANPFPVVATVVTAPATYAAAATGFLNSVTGDILCIGGSASKTVRVRSFRVSAIASATVAIDLSIVMRSTLDTGGTPTSLTRTALDQLNAAATATITAFATAPTAGTLIGAIQAQKFSVPKVSDNPDIPVNFSFGDLGNQPIVLRGVSQAACVLTNALAGGSYDLSVVWTEE